MLSTDPVSPSECPDGPHRGPEGPNEDLAQCPKCWGLSFTMRPEGETYGDHLPDCRLPMRHTSYCERGGKGHPSAAVIRGYWPERCDDPEPHEPHEHYGRPATLRRECPGRRGPRPEPETCPTCGDPHDHVHACAICGRAELDDGRPFQCPVHDDPTLRFEGAVARYARNLRADGKDVTIVRVAEGQTHISSRKQS